MPGGDQLTGGWASKHRRARGARVLASVLAMGAAALLSAVPARAQTLAPDPGPVVTLVEGLLDSVRASTDGIAAPVTAALPDEVVQVLNGVVTVPAPPPADAVIPAALPAAPAEPDVMRGRRLGPTGTTAVLEFARSSTAMLLLALAAAVFLSFEALLARRNPRLTAAPVDRRETELEFR